MKAKDLRGKNIQDLQGDPDENVKPEDDQVTAAYENISKKLDSLRSRANKVEDEGEEDEAASADGSGEPKDEEQLPEWKGPKSMKKAEEADLDEERDGEQDLRKVKLRNLEDRDEDSGKKDDEEEIEPLPGTDEDEKESKGRRDESDESEGEESASAKATTDEKEWKPKQNDPLDEEEDEDIAGKEEGDEEFEDEEKEVDTEKAESSIRGGFSEEREELGKDLERPIRPAEQPDTLDDLTDENLRSPRETEEEASEYFIPHLKGTRQAAGNMGYNTASERESFGESFSPKSSMEGNDPNNFFSQHQQPQAPKRANKFHLLVLVLIGVVVIGFTVYILKGGFGQLSFTSKPSPSPSATATPEPTPTPTPEPIIERGEFTIRVLNGTSTTGLAAKVRDKLKELGYKTLAPRNATDKDVEQTEIRLKEGSQSATLFERLKLDLAPDYDAKEGDKLDAKSTNDAEVILGAK